MLNLNVLVHKVSAVP